MQRPAVVTVFAILNIVFAIIGVIGILMTIALLTMSDTTNNPMIKIMRENPSYAMWMKAAVVLGMVAAVVLLVSGIGLFALKPWARKLALGYAVYAIVMGLFSMVMNAIFVLRPLLEEAQRAQGPEAAGAIGGAIGGSLGGCFGLIYPILILIFMTRPKVVAAFQPSDQPPALPSA